MTIKNKDKIIAELKALIAQRDESITAQAEIILKPKAENETLKKVKDFASINLTNYIADNDKLKAENERLKQEWRLDCLKCEYKNTKADVDKYKQTLQKIKEIIKDCDNGKCFTCKYNKEDAENCVDNRHNEILGLITKAEEQ